MFSRADRSGRAVTLIEVLVALAVGAVISGVLLGILVDTRQAVLRGQRRVDMAAEATSILSHVEAYLVAAVSPASLDDTPTTGTLAFEPDRCSFVSSRHYDGSRLIVTEISNDVAAGRVTAKTLPLRLPESPTVSGSGGGSQGVAADLPRTLGAARREDFSSRVRFGYAVDLPAGDVFEPEYLERLAPGQYPVLVRAAVRVVDLASEPSVDYEVVSVYRMR